MLFGHSGPMVFYAIEPKGPAAQLREKLLQDTSQIALKDSVPFFTKMLDNVGYTDVLWSILPFQSNLCGILMERC